MKIARLAPFIALPLLAQPAHLSPDQFPWRAAITVKEAGGYAAVRITKPFYEKTSASFADLRLFGPANVETPWLLRNLYPARPDPAIPTQTLDQVHTAKDQFQLILDFGVAPPIHNRLVFDIPGDDFRHPVLIESSLDRHVWDDVRTAAILRFMQDGKRLESLTVDYPDSSRRYLRITIGHWKDRKLAASVRAQRTESPNAEDWERLGSAGVNATPLPDQKSTRIEFEYPYGPLEDVRLVVQTPSKEFHRSAALSYSADNKSWTPAGSHILYRVPGAEELTLRSPRLNGLHVRLEIFNGDDQPLDVTAVHLYVPAREAVFPISDAGAYAFHLGLPGAAAPNYDLEKVLARAAAVTPVALPAPTWESNPAYIPPEERPKPFTERFPWLLPAVVALAIALMGAAAYRLIKSPGRPAGS
jgi:hypothetical protein